MTEFMHQPWGGEHRVYRKTVTFLGRDEEINFCDACGTEVYHAIAIYDAARFVHFDNMKAITESDDFKALADRYAELNGVRPDTVIDGQGEHHRLD